MTSSLIKLAVFLALASATVAHGSALRGNSTITIHSHFLLDRSGSMASIKDDVMGGFNSFIATQKAEIDSNDNVLFSLVQFDSNNPHEITFDGVPIQDVPDLETFSPRGGTPLYDAIGQIIERATEMRTEDERTVLVIFTDGQENSSREFNRAGIKKLISDKQAEGWTIVFLGANIDAFAESRGFGLSRMSTQNVRPDSQGIKAMFQSLAGSSVNYMKKARTRREEGTAHTVAEDIEMAEAFFEGNSQAQEDYERRAPGIQRGEEM